MVIKSTPYFHSHLSLRTMPKGVGQSSVRRFLVCMILKLLFAYAKLLYSLIILKYLDNDALISSKTSLTYKKYIPLIIAKQYGNTKLRNKIH